MQGSNAGLYDGREPTEQQLQAARERDRQYFNIPYMLRSSERGYARAPCIRKLACSSASIYTFLIHGIDPTVYGSDAGLCKMICKDALCLCQVQ